LPTRAQVILQLTNRVNARSIDRERRAATLTGTVALLPIAQIRLAPGSRNPTRVRRSEALRPGRPSICGLDIAKIEPGQFTVNLAEYAIGAMINAGEGAATKARQLIDGASFGAVALKT
jgi:hypothetical protein